MTPLTPEQLKALKRSGRVVIQPFGAEIYGPFDTLEDAQKWANLQADMKQRAEDKKW
jgi:hypothetical protein